MMILTKRFCDPPNLSPIGFCGAKVWYFVGVRVYIAICSQRCCRPSAALSQSVRSCRGPIYRARIYVYTHEMEGGMRVR